MKHLPQLRPLAPRSRVHLVAAVLLTATAIGACDSYDDFTASPSALLSLPIDTLGFDTVITTVSTPTKSFVVYNRGKEGLRIARVTLQKGAASPFRVNIDGEAMAAGYVEDLIIRGGDSLFVRAEVTMPKLGHDSIGSLTDTLTFTLESGVQQRVLMTVAGRDGIFWHDKHITSDTTLSPTLPYILYGETVVESGATLTLSAGTTLMFHHEASLTVDGTLLANGTPDSMVVMRGDRTDRMFVNLFYDNTPMRWGGVHLTSHSHDSRLTCADLHSGTWGIVADSTDLQLDSCVLHNIGGHALQSNASRIKACNTQLSNTLGHCLMLNGGDTWMQYCTLAQFYPWVANRGDALYIVGNDDYPLRRAHFSCCLMTGYAEDVIMGDIDDPDNDADYLFSGCFLKTVKSDDELRFVDVTYQEKDDDITERFVLFNTTDFLYDFHINSEEPVPYGIR